MRKINLTALAKSAVDLVFAAGGEAVKAAVFYRPASFSSATGTITAQEQTATVNALLGRYQPWELGLTIAQPAEEKAFIRTTELAGLAPEAGDYLVENATGQRRDVRSARVDCTGQLWTLQTLKSLNEDWGDLTAATVTEDWGDLSAATDFEDRLTLT